MWNRRAGHAFHRRAILRDGFAAAAARLHQRVAQVGARLRVIRADAQRLLELRDRFARSPLVRQCHTQVVMRQIISIGHLQRMLEQRPAILPVADLRPRHRDASRASRDCQQPDRRQCARPPARNFRHAPRQRDRETGHRQIRVPVRARLRTHLHQADNRQQRDHVPRPSHGQVWDRFAIPAKQRRKSARSPRPRAALATRRDPPGRDRTPPVSPARTSGRCRPHRSQARFPRAVPMGMRRSRRPRPRSAAPRRW